MSIDFTIIPTSPFCEDYVETIKERIKNTIDSEVYVDKDYKISLASRSNRYKRQDIDIIIIDKEYINKNIITIRFCDNWNKPKTMLVDEFIDILEGYKNEDEEKELDDNCEKEEKELNDDNNGCRIF